MSLRRVGQSLANVVLTGLLGISMALTPVLLVDAGVLTARSVAIGTSEPGASTVHDFTFTYPGYTNVGSVEFEYCANTADAGTECDVPAGLSVDNAALADQSGETGFTVDGSLTTANKIVLTRGAAATNAQSSTYNFSNVTNPSQANQMTFVRISTFSSEDTTGPRTDSGAVVFSTGRIMSVTGYVPPYITFCTGVTVEINCSSTNGSRLNFGDLVTGQARALASQYSGATNDPGGFSVHTLGTTMTSGNNVIPALPDPRSSRPGSSQFGMNLRANSNPGVGAEPDGPGTSSPEAQMAMPNLFTFGEQIVSRSYQSTDFTRFTASYMVNVSSNQPPGLYSTTVTYVAVAAF